MKRRNFFQSHQAHRYDASKSRYQNPLFAHKKSNNHTKKWLSALGGIMGLLVLGATLIFLPWMQVTDISVNGVVTVRPESLEYAIRDMIQKPFLGFLPGAHRWIIQNTVMESELQSHFELRDVSIERRGRTLFVTATERITRGIWITQNTYFFIDNEGYIIRELNEAEQTEVENQINTQTTPSVVLQTRMFTLWDQSNTAVVPKQAVLTPHMFDVIDRFDLLLEASTISPISYIIEKPEHIWITVTTTIGVDIYLNGAGDPENQFKNLQVILSDYAQDAQSLEYIDLRFGDRVYVR